MLLRLVTWYRRGEALLPLGYLVEAEGPEAEFLLEEGIAVPVDSDKAAVESR